MVSPFQFTPPANMLIPVDEHDAARLIRDLSRHSKLAITGGSTWIRAYYRHVALEQNTTWLSTTRLTGIIEYDPAELTITARAGTPIRDIVQTLAGHGQYLPFDPVLATPGATVGGTLAKGLSGARRLRYGGLRDFVIGLHYLNTDGDIVRGGGKVVKNAAGYDLPKLFCGSHGSLGLITQVSFKVFPLPEATRTLQITFPRDFTLVSTFLRACERSNAEISAAEVVIGAHTAQVSVYVAIEGARDSLLPRLNQIRALIPASAVTIEDVDSAIWEELNRVQSLAGYATVLKCYLPPDRLPLLADHVIGQGGYAQFSAAGNTAWIGMNSDPRVLLDLFATCEISAMVWESEDTGLDLLPTDYGRAVRQRVQMALNPHSVWIG